MKIPKIIHQVYEDPAGPSNILLEMSMTWKKKHPQWEYRFWDKTAMDRFVNDLYPDLSFIYKSLPFNIQRWDMIRYLILYEYGGLYVDMDYECIEPLDVLFCDSSCYMGLEPVGNTPTNSYHSYIVGNALMASVPKHKYIKMIIDEIRQKGTYIFSENKTYQVLESTGPLMTTRVYNSYPTKEDITLLPADLIAPLDRTEVIACINGLETSEIQDKIQKSFAVHYSLCSWTQQTNKIEQEI